MVIQSIKPYVSSEDIDKGARWSSDIARELDESTFGIIIITPDNLDAPWLNFETGALSKTIDKAYVSPFLFRMKRSEVQGPLLQFQSTIYDKEDLGKLLATINNRLDGNERLDENQIKKSFEVWWPQLQQVLDGIEEPKEAKNKKSHDDEKHQGQILEELLELTRTQQKILRSPELLLPADYLRFLSDRGLLGRNTDVDIEDFWKRFHFDILELIDRLNTLSDDVEQKKPLIIYTESLHQRLHTFSDKFLTSDRRTRSKAVGANTRKLIEETE